MGFRDSVSKSKVIMIILSVYFIISLSYILIGYTNDLIDIQSQASFEEGAVVGYSQAVLDIARGVSTCQIFPLLIGNSTIDIVAYQCIQQPVG